MSKYICSFTNNILYGWALIECELDPKKYLYCEDEDEMIDCVTEDLAESIDYGDINVKNSDSDCDIPKGFIEEWKKLKTLNK